MPPSYGLLETQSFVTATPSKLTETSEPWPADIMNLLLDLCETASNVSTPFLPTSQAVWCLTLTRPLTTSFFPSHASAQLSALDL